MGCGPVMHPTGRGALIAAAAAIVAIVLSGPGGARVPVHADNTGQACARETLLWTGTARLGGSQRSVDTGLAVAAPGAGVSLRTVGVSADGLAADGSATVLTVFVGGAPAVPGATMSGGVVRLQYTGSVDVVVNGATVVLDRCTMVASEAPVPGATVASVLPHTGARSGVSSLLVTAAFVCVVVGCGCAVVARRRSTVTAGDLGLRSLPGVRPHARG